jgi:hypothetical protein
MFGAIYLAEIYFAGVPAFVAVTVQSRDVIIAPDIVSISADVIDGAIIAPNF